MHDLSRLKKQLEYVEDLIRRLDQSIERWRAEIKKTTEQLEANRLMRIPQEYSEAEKRALDQEQKKFDHCMAEADRVRPIIVARRNALIAHIESGFNGNN